MNLRSGRVTRYQPIKSKGFNLKGRADNPDPSNILISSEFNAQRMGRHYGVIVLSPSLDKPAAVENAYYYEQNLDKLLALGGVKRREEGGLGKYLLLGYAHNYLYFAQAPLPTRERRPNPKKPRKDQRFPLPPDTDRIEVCAMWNSAATKGSESPTRDAVMGDSALNYAKAVFDEEWAAERKWEWLHIVGHALGGNNEAGNLVAGAFDANTMMIPYEKNVLELTQKAGEYNPVEARYVVTLYPDTWIAIDIEMMYHGCGELAGWKRFPATTTLCFDKLQYDLWTA
ncbi:MAG: hypothetical protein IT167_18935 [Bryobacterales bacterium]|nr:hypothetical protein [Bryobacterales bacterium]